jgi:hypothetical protein
MGFIAEDLFMVLSMDEMIIVFSSEEDKYFYTWNQSATLQCWTEKTNALLGVPSTGQWEETGIQTLSDEPLNFEEARKAARNWYFGDSGEVVITRPQVTDHEDHGGHKMVIIDRPASSKETAKLFGISKRRQRHLDKMVKEILKNEPKSKKSKKRKR